MKIVAVLEVDEDEFFQNPDSSFNDFIKEFIGWDSYPTEEKEAVIITKDSMYGTLGLDTIDLNWEVKNSF